jgi:hypothetical protein
MRVLFDKSAPHGLIRHLRNHVVFTAEDRGWDELENGDLLTAAERDGFEVFLTANKNLRYRQNLSGRAIAIVVPRTLAVAAGKAAYPGRCHGGEWSHARQLHGS